MRRRRAAAVGSLALGTGSAALAIVLAVERFPRGIAVLACLCVALLAGWTALRHEGIGRLLAAASAGAALAATALVLILVGGLLPDLAVTAAFALSVLLARVAFRVRVDLPAAPRPSHPVLFFNPLSGGGKARRFNLAEEARRRGIEPIELDWSRDLRELVAEALTAGADALAMAGGDGSQAIVAEIAAAEELPYACIPAGTRNHFALDLGVDRDDVVGALEALVDGRERRVDLAEVNGRVFVNNVSLGLYADAVRQDGYRDAKLQTLLAVAPTGLGDGPEAPSIRWREADGRRAEGAVALLVSNDVYRLGTMIGSGTRPRLDEGVLGVATVRVEPGPGGVSARFALRQWSSPGFTVEGEAPVAAGIDGESATLTPPIRFESRPGALHVRIARAHPGASPSTGVPRGLAKTLAKLFRIAIGGDRAAADVTHKANERSSDGRLRGGAT
ncbi:MAG: diacylglycerol kinase [Actinobacteria bacterium]|nr:diacylglycerol kinase [Actinomycetota bacterium]